MKALTDGFLRAIRPPKTGRRELRDSACRGLFFRITAADSKSWSFRYRPKNGGKVARVTLGTYPDIGLSKAREFADDMRRGVAYGGHPAQTRRRARMEAEVRSFEHLANRYMTEHAERRKRSHLKDRRNLANHILPKWRTRDYRTIRRTDVIELLEGVIASGKHTAANRLQSLISGIFSFALDAELVEANPCHRLRKRGVETVGNRVLSDAEIRLFWSGIMETEQPRRTGFGLRLALLTGARVSEISGMGRDELEHIDNPGKAAWIIAGTRTKNGKDHYIPLPPLARATVLELLALIKPEEPFLFATGTHGRSGPIPGNTLSQSMRSFTERLSGADAASWKAEPPTPHDLRRTAETRMAALRIPKEIRDRVLNHVGGDVGSKHYNRHDYAEEKRDALTRWDALLSSILGLRESSVVVPLHSKVI
jgi:integrase